MRAKFFVVRKIRSIDKVPRNVGLMIRETKSDMACAVPKRTPVRERKREKKREKERKRAKESRQKRENLKFFRVFFRQSFLFFLVSLSLRSL